MTNPQATTELSFPEFINGALLEESKRILVYLCVPVKWDLDLAYEMLRSLGFDHFGPVMAELFAYQNLIDMPNTPDKICQVHTDVRIHFLRVVAKELGIDLKPVYDFFVRRLETQLVRINKTPATLSGQEIYLKTYCDLITYRVCQTDTKERRAGILGGAFFFIVGDPNFAMNRIEALTLFIRAIYEIFVVYPDPEIHFFLQTVESTQMCMKIQQKF